MNRLDDKVAIITGAAAGIGLATARLFSEAGAKVVLADVNDARASAEALGGDFVETDVTDAEAVERLVAVTVERHQRVDVMVNNAGIELVAPLAATNLDKHREILGADEDSAVIGARNQRAVDVLISQLDSGSKRIAIFYGVAHMPDLEERLIEQLDLVYLDTAWVDAWRLDTRADR